MAGRGEMKMSQKCTKCKTTQVCVSSTLAGPEMLARCAKAHDLLMPECENRFTEVES